MISLIALHLSFVVRHFVHFILFYVVIVYYSFKYLFICNRDKPSIGLSGGYENLLRCRNQKSRFVFFFLSLIFSHANVNFFILFYFNLQTAQSAVWQLSLLSKIRIAVACTNISLTAPRNYVVLSFSALKTSSQLSHITSH